MCNQKKSTLMSAVTAIFFMGFIAVKAFMPGLTLAATVPDTGQIGDYTSTFGEDSDYTINPPSYTKLDADGDVLDDSAPSWVMVRDNVTGLIWEVKTNDGSIHDRDDRYGWQTNEQSTFIVGLNDDTFGGYSDWRLPTIKELSFITDKDEYLPSINTAYFPNTQSSSPYKYWSSTLSENSLGYAWNVSFRYGDVSSNSKANSYYVRAVRGGQSLQTFNDNGDGTVTNEQTGLMWQQDTDTRKTWQTALTYCETLILNNDGEWTNNVPNGSGAKYDDWRLPSSSELQSLVDYGESNPSINTGYFPGAEASNYRSSTTNAGNTGNAWVVDFLIGRVSNYSKFNNYYVRAVRSGGQCAPFGDSDSDGICDDGDSSGVIGDDPCTGGNTALCDDNCIDTSNTNQADVDNDGIGNACDSCTDVDEDDYGIGIGCTGEEDCNDDDDTINPGAAEVCDGIDNNCDGEIDEGVKTTYYRDFDDDGYGDINYPEEACSAPGGYVEDNTDCFDWDAEVNPAKPERCASGRDDDCDGKTDCADEDCDGMPGGPFGGTCEPYGETICSDYLDNDNDGKADCFDEDCDGRIGPQGLICQFGVETTCDDGFDNDYDGMTDCCDVEDCGAQPECQEICDDEIDNDCDGMIDCEDEEDCENTPACPCSRIEVECYSSAEEETITSDQTDCDDDSFVGYTCQEGQICLTANCGDCDDDDATVYPGAIEICDDGKDNDCNGEADDCPECTADVVCPSAPGPATLTIGDTDCDGFVIYSCPEEVTCTTLNCNDNCPDDYNPDQLDSDGNGIGDICDGPVLIKLASFTASPKAGRVVLRWLTESEIDNAGYSLYRAEAEDGKYIKINDSLIPAKGSPAQGASYEFVDNGVRNGKTYYYKLEDIDIKGVSTVHETVNAKPRLIYWILGK